MKKNVLINCFFLLSAFTMLSAQNASVEHKIMNYLDPDYPGWPNVQELKSAEKAELQLQMREYLENHDYMPASSDKLVKRAEGKFVGPDKDMKELNYYEWYAEHPYFPQPVFTGNPLSDKRMFLKARDLWIKYNPKKYHLLRNLVISDEEFRRKYAFIIEK